MDDFSLEMSVLESIARTPMVRDGPSSCYMAWSKKGFTMFTVGIWRNLNGKWTIYCTQGRGPCIEGDFSDIVRHLRSLFPSSDRAG